jgi:hypothetical protein
MTHRVAGGCAKSSGNQHGEPMGAIRARDLPDRPVKGLASVLRHNRHQQSCHQRLERNVVHASMLETKIDCVRLSILSTIARSHLKLPSACLAFEIDATSPDTLRSKRPRDFPILGSSSITRERIGCTCQRIMLPAA